MNDEPSYGSLFLTGNFPVYKEARFLEAVPWQPLCGPELIFSGRAVDLLVISRI
jgi:hypothetical protein